ncbi:exported protein of unknown function [Acidithiobacillus ferrivorans]|uniref:Outer membrane protein beta-barrel domain-containing protein n=1 Tax=Acidithiobacillus ferrivorans TaxID=160808 RepID=A0A060UVF1_9PROT|nr:hypothetical protein [Acidithiobacillus ferrivorans]CDQ10504.1 exported hypothetical protein [Acidithiobacillus ferrivorans]SMH64534.1 exported protein of unknown function [Acidithiobacillus ferrivorans]
MFNSCIRKLHHHKTYSRLAVSALFISLIPATAMADSVGVYGGASNFALRNITPEIGIIARAAITHGINLRVSLRHATANSDINGGAANVFSTRLTDYFALNQSGTFKVGPYVGNQYLSYGHLYNNAVGGGLGASWKTPYEFTLAAHAGALYGLDGTIGENLKCAGNLFEVGGRMSVPVSHSWSLFALGGFERYVGNGNALTSINGGAGAAYHF